jgi:hypothetical protein
MLYRRPVVYIPPYNYCDRWCERCRIDKDRCLLYQTEMDDRLHREIDGKGDPTPEEVAERISRDLRSALRMVEQQVRDMGFDPEEIKRQAREAPPAERDPIIEEGFALTRAVAAFVRANGAAFPEEAEVLRWYMTLPGPKLGRAAARLPGDAMEEADAVLQAQVVHKALAAMGAALDAIRGRRPALGDAMIELLALMKRLREEIEARWLRRPCELLEPAPGDAWWGPLRDITPTLKHFRR